MQCLQCHGPLVLEFRKDPCLPYLTRPFRRCVTCRRLFLLSQWRFMETISHRTAA